ncbi:uncharacterized protein LOC107849093 [Capsicum annuum]|uniref:uncharacterized protein LOC107849093 n=1 Tax=Capsicum annuum TaxID=4072 RepID=UPI001FB17941|nr:uncharacterized protein LOC107849093 [Capsicum annuum]
MDELRQAQEEKFQEALDMGEIETCKGLNQEFGLARVGNTRWDLHYKSFKNFISMFGCITDVLDTIIVGSESVEEKARATGYLRTYQMFEVVFIFHLMRDILAITNELIESLQKKEQDIANIVLLVKVVKNDCKIYGMKDRIHLSKMCLHFVSELNDRFNEVRTDLLIGVACLNPVDSFSNFDINKILRMTELYPDDFGKNIIVTLKNQLETYIFDVRDVDESLHCSCRLPLLQLKEPFRQ